MSKPKWAIRSTKRSTELGYPRGYIWLRANWPDCVGGSYTRKDRDVQLFNTKLEAMDQLFPDEEVVKFK